MKSAIKEILAIYQNQSNKISEFDEYVKNMPTYEKNGWDVLNDLFAELLF